MQDNNQTQAFMEMFVFEANQLLEQLESILLESEKNKNISHENINEIFRIMHTIKGSSAMMSLGRISNVAHKLEDMFFFIREENPSINVTEINDLIFKVLDYIKYNIENLQEGQNQQEDDKDGCELADRIKDYLLQMKNSCKKGSTQSDDNTKNNNDNQHPTNYKNPAEIYQNTYKITVFFDNYCNMINVRSFLVINRLSEFCNVISYFPEQLSNDENILSYIITNGLEIILTSNLSSYELRDFIDNITDVKIAVVQLIEDNDSEIQHDNIKIDCSPKHEDNAVINNAIITERENKVRIKKEENRQVVKQNIISVNINKLDKLMDIVGEIVISQSMVTNNPDLEGLKLENFPRAAMHLRKLTDELQDLVLSVRMIPIDMSFSKMHRIVRDMSNKLDKEVVLEIIGESTEVDKNVIDNLSDPLMHLIRNCMDHGIESKEERIKANKNPVGKIILEARNTGGDVVITITDDGRGLDRQKVLEKARKSGLLTKNDDEVSDKEVYNYILLPGFSTKEKVTEFSGRGVGMDVVKKNIENVRGSITVDSKTGQGTVITIKIPLTLAIIDGMLVKTGKNTYIIPTQSIIESFRPKEYSVFTDTQGNEMTIIRGKCYPVIRLHEFFKVETKAKKYEEGIIIVTEASDKKICLFADEIIGQQPIVVKSLCNYLTKFKLKEGGIAGYTILGDGSISLILDISEIGRNYFFES